MYPRILSKICRDWWLIRQEMHESILATTEQAISHGPLHRVYEDDEGARVEADHDTHREYFEVGSTAIIPVCGVLGKHLEQWEMNYCGGCSMDKVASLLDIAGRSPRIRDIVLNFDTPGGTYMGTPELARKIREAAERKHALGGRMKGFCDSECCSGGVWLASQCDDFYCTESAIIGSVGVRMILLDYSKMLDESGVKVNPIVSGKFKIAGSQLKPLTDEEREMFQSESDRIHADFKAAVTSIRPVDEEHLQGQTFYGAEATQKGFTDGLVDDLDSVLAMVSAPGV